MPWAKKKPMTWEWFSFVVSESEVAGKLQELAAARHKISFVLPSASVVCAGGVLIITCKGTPIPAKTKAAETDTDEA